MGWQKLEGTNWEVNTDGLYAVIRGVEAYRAIQEHSSSHKDKRFSLSQFLMPSIEEIKVDWKAVNSKVELRSRNFYDLVLADLPNQPENAFKNLSIMVEEGRKKKDNFRRTQQDITSRNLDAIRAANTLNEIGYQGLRLARDGSIITFVILATGPGAGAALGTMGQVGAIGLGSTAKGYATWQDTGNVGAALLSGSTTIVTSLIGVWGASAKAAGALSKAESYALVAIEYGMEGSRTGIQALVEGRSVQAAITESLMSMGLKYTGDLMEIETMSIPVQASYKFASDRATSFMGKEMDRGHKPPAVTGKMKNGGLPAKSNETSEFMRKHVLRSVP